MSSDFSTRFEVARVVIEAASPFLIGVADGDRSHDATFSTDASGLPTIPGETLAGILRHAVASAHDEATADQAFGYQRGDRGSASFVEVSWAHVHDANDAPRPFRSADPVDDPVLRLLVSGVSRDHVRIDKNGAADDMGKFDVLLVPAGARFSFELRIHDGAGITAADLVGILNLPETMIGRMGRTGLGRFRVVRAAHRSFDLTRPDDRKAWKQLPVALELPDRGRVLAPLKAAARKSTWRHAKLELTPRSTWYVGGATDPMIDPPKRDKSAKDDAPAHSWDRVPMAERRIVWSGPAEAEKGAVSERPDWLLPGSSLKGVLRHRAGFHARLLAGRTWDPANPDSLASATATTPAELALFGAERGREDAGGPGRVRVGEARLARPEGGPQPKVAPFDHVSLDRFTQGPIDGRLFNEVALAGGPKLEVDLAVDTRGLDDPHALEALRRALTDLCEGRLAVGAASSRGHGLFKGTLTWDGGAAPWETLA